jgi:signal transduction histidine kinase
MNAELTTWLTEHRDHLLPQWVSSLSVVTTPANGDGTGVLIDRGDHTATTHPPFPGPPEETAATLNHIYDGLIQAAHGNLDVLNNHLHSMCSLTMRRQTKLTDLLTMTTRFRHLAWETLQTEATDITSTFSLLHNLEELLDYTTRSITRSWELHTEEEIQERISQAEFIAESMATAIEQADRTALQLSSLNEASQRLAANLENPLQLIQQAGTTLYDLLGAAHISIWMHREMLLPLALDKELAALADDQADLLYAVGAWGNEREAVKGLQLAIVGKSDAVIRAYTQANTVYEPKPPAATQGSWYQTGCGVFALPINVKGQLLGVVAVQDSVPEERLSRSQQNLALAVVNQAAIAIENARLYARIRQFNTELEGLVAQRTSELQEEKERLATIHEISTEISSTLDLDMLLQTSLEALARITQVEYGSIMLVEADTGHLVNRAMLGQGKINAFTRFPIGHGVAGWVAQHREPALIVDVREDNRWVDHPLGESAPGKNHGSMLAVPLVAHSEVLGVLILSHAEKGYFDEGHLRLLTASASAIAVGINNANMYTTIFEEMERNSELLQRQHIETTKMEAILQSLSDGVLVCDTYGEILSVNPAAGRILQRDIEDLLFRGTTLHDVLDQLVSQPGDKMPLADLLSTPLGTHGKPRVFETVVEVDDVRVISLSLGPVLKTDGELMGALLLMHDVTREVEADRLKTEFIGTMSHELRTPMTAIKGFTQLLAMGGLGPVNDTQREFLQTIQANSERMISIINDVLDITKIETGSIDLDLRPIHLAEAISGVMGELQTLVQNREHTLHINIPSGLPLVCADSGRLHQALHNLISNAVKYTPTGGEIAIEAHEANNDELPPHVRDKVTIGRRYVQVDIRDTGVGIASHELERVFERFYRTENPLKVEAGGTGLGLSLVKPLIELFGGRIWAESTLNEGSTFRFILPITPDS